MTGQLQHRRLLLFPIISIALWCVCTSIVHAQVQADFTVDVDSGAAPLSVQFFDLSTPQDSVIFRAWDLNGDGAVDSQEKNPRFTYEVPGRYTVTLLVADSAGYDTLRREAYIHVAAVEENDIAVRIRVVDAWGPVAAGVELWGYTGSGFPMPFSPISIRIGLDSAGYATFYRAKFIPMMTQNITDLYVLDVNGAVIGKTGFHYPLKDFSAGRRKDAIVVVHRDLVTYHNHPIERTFESGWKFPSALRFPWHPGQPALPFVQGGDPVTGPLYQISMLIPPAALDSSAPHKARYVLNNIRPSRKPLVLLHGLGYRDAAWGEDTDILAPDDFVPPDYGGKRDYVWTSYAGRLQAHDAATTDAFDVWQYVYPPDQPWEESGYLFARDLAILLAEYDTAVASVVAAGMGGLLLRSYLQGTARNYLFSGLPSDSATFRGDIDRAVMLGTPHGGQRLAALAYGTAPLLPGFMDAAAPALRELTPASGSLLRLADAALPSQVALLAVAGSALDVPFTHTPTEAPGHDDVAVSVSSAMLDRPGVWNGVLAGFTSTMLQAPRNDPHGHVLPDAWLLPHIIHAFLLHDTALTALGSSFLLLHRPDSMRFPQTSYTIPSVTRLRADIGLPLLRMTDSDDTPILPDGAWRIRLSMQAIPRLIVEHIDDGAMPDDAGMFLYPAALSYGNTVQRELAAGRPGLYAVSRSGSTNPLLQLPILHDGAGWQLPSPPESFLASPALAMRDDAGRIMDIEAPAGDLHLHWSRSVLSDLRLSRQAGAILGRPGQLHAVTRGALEFHSDCLSETMSFVINHAGRQAPIFRLHAPDSSILTQFDANDSSFAVSRNNTLGILLLTLYQPAQGLWQLELDGQFALPERCTLSLTSSSPFSATMALSTQSILVGDTALITVRTHAPPALLLDSLEALCVIVDSLGFSEPLLLRDDGIAPDTLAGDGVFAGWYRPAAAGSYTVEATVHAVAGGCRVTRPANAPLHVRTGLELLSPLGGEEWKSGEVERIRWHGDAPSHVSLWWSDDNGVTWEDIVQRHPAQDGWYDWLVPARTSIHCLLRIADADGWRADTTRSTFTVYEQPGIIVFEPSAGHRWQVGSVQELRWQAVGIRNLSISYSVDAGVNWLPVAANIDAKAASWLWTVPVTPSDSCLLRLTDSDDATIAALSALFSITPAPAITVLAPNGGERWQEGSMQTIRWMSASVDSVDVEYSFDGGVQWLPVGRHAAAAGQLQWTVPAVETDRALIRITAVDIDSLSDDSDGVFSIIPVPRLRITAPVGGEYWEIASRETIRWESAGIQRVDIDYSTDNGVIWRTVAVNQPAEMKAYVWLVPIEPTDIARIRISDTYDSTRESMSPAVFTISESLTRPTLFAPSDATIASSTRPNFIWLPFHGATGYHLQVSNDRSFGFLTFEERDFSGTTFASPELVASTTYYWRVRARLGAAYTDWSSTWSFSTGTSIYSAPALLLPHDGALGLYANVQFSWSASDSAASWHIQVSEFPNFSRIFAEDIGVKGMTHSISGFAENGDYFWRVRGGDAGSSVFGDWSRAFTFSTAPPPPRHLAPFDGMPDVSLSPLLQWYPVEAARVYRVQVSRDAMFTTIIHDSSITAGSMQLSGLSSFTSYYWRMTVTTNRGSSRWSDAWMFRTINLGTSVDARPAELVPRIRQVWPMPGRDILYVQFSGSGDATIELHDLLGRRLVSRTMQDAGGSGLRTVTLSITDFPSGAYILRLLTPSAVDQRMVLTGGK
jgi:PKD repeat protein